MMIHPNMYKEQLSELTIEEIIIKRNKLLDYIRRYEENRISEEEKMTKPSPETLYIYDLQYLKMTTEKMIELLDMRSAQNENIISYIDDYAKNYKDERNKEQKALDDEYDELSKRFEERFNRKPYIAEPSGTIEQAISAIKTCLEKDEDILDKIYYPNKDVLY